MFRPTKWSTARLRNRQRRDGQIQNHGFIRRHDLRISRPLTQRDRVVMPVITRTRSPMQ